ncbi:MAG: hypothetical protein C4304_10090 [candidate division GAL15 bacterium]
MQAEARLDGKVLLRTSDDTLAPVDVALGYKQLIEVEEAFRTLKHTLELRPVCHRKDERIRAHVLLCWLALLLVRVAEVRGEERLRQRHSWERIRTELERMHLGYFRGQAGVVYQLTETMPFQARLFEATGVAEPPRFFRIDPAQASA